MASHIWVHLHFMRCPWPLLIFLTLHIRISFSHITMVSDGRLLFPILPLNCAFVLQLANISHVVAFESWTMSPPKCFTRTACHCDSISLLLNHWNSIFEPMCVSVLFPEARLLFLSYLNDSLLWVLACNLVVLTTAKPLLLFPQYSCWQYQKF